MVTSGKIIEYLDNGKFVCAFVTECQDKRTRSLNQNGREVNLPGRLGGIRRGNEEGTAPHDVLAGDQRQVLTPREVEGRGASVNLGKLRLGKGDANRSLAF